MKYFLMIKEIPFKIILHFKKTKISKGINCAIMLGQNDGINDVAMVT